MSSPDRTAIAVPYLGSATQEATVTAWRKNPGDTVQIGDVVCDIATDKVDTEVEANASGVLIEIVAEVGNVVPVGEPLAWLGSSSVVPEPEVMRIGANEVRIPTDRPKLSPLARRRMASADADDSPKDAPFDITQISSSTADLAAYAGVPAHVTSVSRRRRLIAEHLTHSYATAPHARVDMDVHLHQRARDLEEARVQRRESGRPEPSYLTVIAHAVARTLPVHPRLNATYAGDSIVEWRQVNLGIAVDTTDGLIVPVVHEADRLSFDDLTDRIAALALKARGSDLKPDEVQQGTFTLSSLGAFGVAALAPVIHQPQVAILGIPTVQQQLVPVDSSAGVSLVVRPVIRLTLTFDHRAVDGADAARFLAALRSQLERDPEC